MPRFAPAFLVVALLPFTFGCPRDVEPTNGLDAPVAVEEGGTGATDAATARLNLATAGLGDSNIFGATQTISAGAAAPGLVVVAAAGQAEALQQWRSATGTVVASVAADGSLSGVGSGLTALSASAISSGTIDPARLAPEVCRLDLASTFTSGQVVQPSTAADISQVVQGAMGQTANLQEWQDDQGATLAFVDPTGSFSGGGTLLTDLNASNLASGTVPSARVSGTYANAVTFSNVGNDYFGNGSNLTGIAASTLAAGTYANVYTFSNITNVYFGDGSNLTGVTTGGLAAGTYANAYSFTNPANDFTGDGSAITNLTISGTYSDAVNFDDVGNAFRGSFTGDGSALVGIAKVGMRPSAGCTVIAGGTEVECSGMPCGAALTCGGADPTCQPFCVDSATPLMSRPYPLVSPTSPGLLQVFAARPALICRMDAPTWVDVSVTVGGVPASAGEVLLGVDVSSLTPWRLMPAAINSGTFVAAGPTSITIDATLNSSPPYGSAVCFFAGPTLTVSHTPGMGGL